MTAATVVCCSMTSESQTGRVGPGAASRGLATAGRGRSVVPGEQRPPSPGAPPSLPPDNAPGGASLAAVPEEESHGRARGTRKPKGNPERRARGFTRAGGLIGAQLRTAAARRGFAQARLRALWPEIAGPEFAAICAPVRLAQARGPAGGLLTLAVTGAHAPRLQMPLPVLRERVNAALAGAVGRISSSRRGRLRRAAGGLRAARRCPAAPAGSPPALSSIGDDRAARRLGDIGAECANPGAETTRKA